jgi:membrane-bound lytic murein transglycosylase D
MKFRSHPQLSVALFAAVAFALGGCQSTGGVRETGPVSQPVPLPYGEPIVVAELPPEISAPITPPSSAPLPPESDVLTSGQVLDRLKARLSTPTCIVGPNNTKWRHKYAGYPDHFADEVQATLPMMLVVLDEIERRKLPGEFALIPIVESWYRTDARSFGAAGMWQIIAETARNNGATVIGGYDGRLSVLDSTQAALTYLGKLHGMFNDWRLTAMAYNSGEYRVMRTMPADELQARGAGHVDYRRPEGLSNTTYEYVAKLRALTCLLAEPERQSIPLERNATVVHWVPYTVPADVHSLDELARRLGADADDLKTYNHGYRNGRIVADAPRTLLVPASTKPRWTNLADQTTVAAESVNATAPSLSAEAATAADAKTAAAAGSDESGNSSNHVSRTHTVAHGETLFSIARHYSIGVEQLRAWNHLGRHARVRTGMKLKLAP